VIPFTTDIDIASWIEDYHVDIKKAFLGNKNVWLWKTLGKIERGLEMRLYSDTFDFDLFYVYKVNDTHQWSSFQVNRYHYQFVYIIFSYFKLHFFFFFI
jgi:hypothetical protein